MLGSNYSAAIAAKAEDLSKPTSANKSVEQDKLTVAKVQHAIAMMQ